VVNGMMPNRMLARVVVVLALAAAAGLALWKHTVTVAASQPAAQQHAVPVSTLLRACPAPGLTGAPDSHVALIAGPASAGAGRATVSYLGSPTGTPLVSATQPGVLSLAGVRAIPAPAKAKAPKPRTSKSKTPNPKATPAKTATPAPGGGQAVTTVPQQGGVVIQASGSMARGLEAEQSSDGKVATRCAGPSTDFWFAGPGVFTAPRIYLYLMNPGSQPADVSVQGFTDAGPLVGSTDTGIAVAPHSMVVQSLSKMLHGARAVALHVRASVGQVVAAAEEITGTARSGAWLPALAAPANQVVLPGMPQTAGIRQLFVAVPGSQDANITLRAITDKGTYEPTGGSGLDIPGGSVAEVPLSSLSGIPGALEVSANVPVTATLMVPGGPKGSPGSFAAATPAVQEQGVVASNVSGGGSSCQLVLSAPGHAVTVRVAEIAVGGGAAAATSKVIQIPAKHSLVQQIGPSAGSHHGVAFAVIVTPQPGSGPLYAARVIAGSGKGGALQSILPVPSALTSVPLPSVRNALISAGG
jgi:hypothetical protein